jgi:hypothetical protein
MAIKIDKDNLEKAMKKVPQGEQKISREEGRTSSFPDRNEEIGFHKGALNTLSAERNELIKMIANVEAIMHAHLKRLEELGVKVQK